MTCENIELHENDTALSALHLYWLMGVDIFHFRIVIPFTMYFLCICYELNQSLSSVTHIVLIMKMVQK